MNRMRRVNGTAPRGFTLAEMLAVVAVIGVLCALMLPAISRTQGRAKAIHCLSNLRQLGLGLQQYAATDLFGRLPPDPVGDNAPAWVYALTPHLGSVDGVRLCPADAFGEARRAWKRTSYVRNQYTAREPLSGEDDPLDPGPAVPGQFPQGLTLHPSSLRLASYRRPSETFLAFEGSNVGVLFPPVVDDRAPVPAFDDHTHPDTWSFGWAHVLADIDPERHGRTANYLFADGHAAAIAADTLRRRLESGENFAAIPE